MQSLFQAIQCPVVWTCPTDDSDFSPSHVILERPQGH